MKVRIKTLLLTVLWCFVKRTDSACSTQLIGSGVIKAQDISVSSSEVGKPPSQILTDGWCADSNQQGEKWIEFDLGSSGLGINGVIIGPLKSAPKNYFKTVLVQYAPVGSSNLTDFHFFNAKKFEIKADIPTSQNVSFVGIPASRIRFTLKEWNDKPCLNVELRGCTIRDLCDGDCENNGVCHHENFCQCRGGHTGDHCEIKPCTPSGIPLQSDMLKVSSEDSFYSKDQLPNGGSNRGWCPSASDKSPSLEIKLPKPLAVSVFQFHFIEQDLQHTEIQYMREFELQYIAPTDSSKTFRTFSPNVPALNGSHYLMVTTKPVVVTDTIRIVPSTWEKRACFKLAIQGCEPNTLCNPGFCKNGGVCVGNNVCKCPTDFFGDTCEITRNKITSNNLGFTRIDNKTLYTTSFTFTITGTITLTTVSSEKVLALNGPGSYITLDKSQVQTGCLADIDHCKTGFTIGLDINFNKLVNNTFLISSGGNLPGFKGIALYYLQNQLVYVVSTSTKVWTLTVKYQPVLSTWHHFEITWNTNLGIGLYVDGKLLGTIGRPVSRPSATQTASICIGCSHTTNQIVIDMLVKAIQTWSLDRTDLVNARVVPGVTPSPKTSVPAISTTKVATSDSSTAQTATGTATNTDTSTASSVGTTLSTPDSSTAQTSSTNIGLSTSSTGTQTATSDMTTAQPSTEVPTYKDTSTVSSDGTPLATSDMPTGQTVTGVSSTTNTASTSKPTTSKPKTGSVATSQGTTSVVPQTAPTTQACPLAAIPIQPDMLKVSSQESYYSKDQLPNSNTTRGWCPLDTDKSPVVEIKLSKPLAVGLFQFYYLHMDPQHPEKRFLREFELQYIAPTDSSKLFRTYAPNVPALNGTHFLTVSAQPVVVTDTIRMVSSAWEKRACFKLAIEGCEPNNLCSLGFCKNGGTCMGNNVCLCPDGFYGDSCEITKNKITSNNLGFTKIDNKTLYTASFNFTISGTITLTTASSEKVITINGPGSYITLDKSQLPSGCFTDIDHCRTGFTIGLDINFKTLVDNTFIISSGGNLPGFKGIALYYLQNQLIYVVSTSTKVWTLTVKYQPVLNLWQHFEITWNTNLGVGLYVDGHLLGTFGRPTTRPPVTQTASICIGCSHTTNQILIDMLIKAIQTWSLDRTNLVNARVVPAVTTPSPTTSPSASQTSPEATASVTGVPSNTNTSSTPKPTTSKPNSGSVATSQGTTSVVPQTAPITQTCSLSAIPIQPVMLKVSSQDSYYSKDQLPNSNTTRGWCPSDTDTSPVVEIKLSKPLAVGLFKFYYLKMDQQHQEKRFLREFELQYIAPTDSSKLFRTYAPNVPALNGTHFLTVSAQPVVVTDTIRMVSSAWEKRACFKLAIQGCDPNNLCSLDFCKNGGTCMGNNVCLCPDGFYGDSCEITKNKITSNNLGFTKIDNKTLYTASFNFTISGTITLTTVSSEKVITINGPGSYITLDKSQLPSGCFTDIDHCRTGFTIGLDINFKTLVDNTFIISSGGNLPGFKGIALYYLQNQLIYVVSTSTKVWTLTVKYQPVLNLWQHFEITWNTNLGVGLYVDGHLLGTFGRPTTRPPVTQTASICIGCSHTTNQILIDMLIKAIQTWSLDRTNLVNARVVPAVTTPSPTTSPSASQTSPEATASSKAQTAIKVSDASTAFPKGTATTPVNANVSSVSQLSSKSSDVSSSSTAQISSKSSSTSTASSILTPQVPDIVVPTSTVQLSSQSSASSSTTPVVTLNIAGPNSTAHMSSQSSALSTPSPSLTPKLSNITASNSTVHMTSQSTASNTASPAVTTKLPGSVASTSTAQFSSQSSVPNSVSPAVTPKRPDIVTPNSTAQVFSHSSTKSSTSSLVTPKLPDLAGPTSPAKLMSSSTTPAVTSNLPYIAGPTSTVQRYSQSSAASTASPSLTSKRPDILSHSSTVQPSANASTGSIATSPVTSKPSIVAAPTSTPRPASKSSTVSIASSEPKTSSSATKQVTTTVPPVFQSYNLTFQTIIGNILITPTFNFTVHGHPVLKLQEKGQTALVLNGTKQYVELPDKGIPCLEKMADCHNGFTMQLEVKFTQIDVTRKTYIISSGGDKSGTSGTALYLQGNQLVFAVKKGIFHWTGACNVTTLIKLNVWYNIEVSWSMTGIIAVINGHLVINETRGTPYPGTSVTNPVLIGKTEGANYTAYMMIRNLFTWTTSREVLVSQGVIDALTTALPTSSTSKPTTPTTTKVPIVEYLWNFTNNIQTNTTVHGQTTIKEGGMVFQNSSQYIDFGNKIECLTNPDKCHNGLTIQFTIQFKKLEENTYLLTSGGETPNGVGFAVVYRYGRLQFILSTITNSWFASCGREKLTPTEYHVIMVSWHQTSGLFIYIDNHLVDFSKAPTPHETAISTVQTVYFGKPHFSISTSVRVDYLVQLVHIWYVRLEILIQVGICQPPEPATTAIPPTASPTTSARTATTSPSTKQQTMTSPTNPSTPKVTRPSTLTPSTVQQCPAGCVSIASSTAASVSSPQTSSQASRTTRAKPTATQASPTPRPTTTVTSTRKPKPSATTTAPLTPPAPDTATPPTSTVRTIPEYHERPKIHAIVGKDDKKAYLACTFKRASESGVEITVSLMVEGKVVLTASISGTTGIYLFAVSQVDDNLHKKQIQCSIKARYSGSNLTTNTTISNTFVPQFQVTPNRLTVTEGHSAGHVTVTSTAPPQFYCCKGCKGSCQIHIVTSWTYDSHDLKCDKKVIAQAVIGSTKPQTYNKYICGFSLTLDNWNKGNKIPVKATLDGRRDGDHTNTLKVLANIYNQPVGVTITTTRPALTFQVSTVSVLIKDNHKTATCKSVNDPHMTTFDGQRYDNMNEGQYVLYRHKTMPFEVRADYQQCKPKSKAYCNCAVAIKSGDDVITITGCQDDKGNNGNSGHPGRGHGVGLIMQQLFGHNRGHGHGHAHGHDKHDNGRPQTPMTIQMYINGQLTAGTVVRRFGCGQKYEIELPTGTVITVQQSYKPFINIWIKASSSDWQQTEGLCGSYDGHKFNDLTLSSCRTACVSHFIAYWKASVNSNFFLGVGVSSVTTGQMYCSCVEGKESICSPGQGVMKCSKSRYDVTSTLVQQAKRPVLRTTRTKRQAVAVTPTTQTDTTDDSGVSFEEAMVFCSDAIMNNTVTTSCQPILTSNISTRIEDCAKDYNATGLQVWALDHIRDIAIDCVNDIERLKENNTANSTNAGVDLLKTLANTCVDVCVHGSCTNGVCECEMGYTGETCNISSSTRPTVSSVPYLCDTSESTDCRLAMVYGDNFVKSDNLTCHIELIELKETITPTGTSSTSKAMYISLNQVACLLPSHTSASVRLSNDGATLSDSSFQYIVYSPDCHDCYIVDNTTEPRCDRKVDSCIINDICYKAKDTSPDDTCHVCLPQSSNDSWSESKAAECVGVPLRQKADDDTERTQVIILAVVCAVFGALLLLTTIYICRKRQNVVRKKESGDYHVADLHRSDFKETAMDNPTYLNYKM